MKNGTKLIILAVVCVLVLLLTIASTVFLVVRKISNIDEYTLGNDTIKAVKVVVDKRRVLSVSTEISSDLKTKFIDYQSDTVQDDLTVYTQYLQKEAGFQLLSDMDLSQISSSIQMGKESADPGEILLLTIDYDAFGYSILLEKGKGTLPSDEEPQPPAASRSEADRPEGTAPPS